jgi:hypothetical protein
MSSRGMISIHSREAKEPQAWPNFCLLLCALLYSILSTGCVVAPIPMTKRVEAPREANGRTAPDLSLLHPGQSTRKDVLEKLSVIDTGYTGQDLFFGRWVSSGSGWVWMIAGDNVGDGGYWPNWRVHNLLVRFDTDGTLKDFNEVDDKQVLKTVARLSITQQQMANLVVPTEMQVQCRRALVNVTLGVNSVVFDHSDPPKIHLRIAATQIVSLRLLRSHHPDPASLLMRMAFQSRTALGRKIQFTISPADAVRITQHVQSVNSSERIFH